METIITDFVKKLARGGFLLSLGVMCVFAQVDEAVIKAIAFEQIARFIEWPESKLSSDLSVPIVIGLVGNNEVSEHARVFYKQQKIKGHPVKTINITDLDQLLDCQIVHIAGRDKKLIKQVHSRTHNLPILTISDLPGSTSQGILLDLYVKNNQLRFVINETAFHQSELEIGSMLLNVAEVVNPRKRR